MNLLSNKIPKIYHDYCCDLNMELKSLNSNYSAACFICLYHNYQSLREIHKTSFFKIYCYAKRNVYFSIYFFEKDDKYVFKAINACCM